jgi:NAD(P)-dependent dehydrogenase (short-subunit alcohol dehydrogenase family)
MERERQTAVVTGASRGLGLALSHALVARGYRVWMVARDGERLAAAGRTVDPTGTQVVTHSADLSRPDAVVGLLDAIAEDTDEVDVLVNNASTLGPVPMRLLLDTTPDALARVLQVNLMAPFRLIGALAGRMALRGHGVVVDISSDAAVEAYPTWGAYGASKAALDHVTRTFAAELEGTGVRFLAVDPGEMDTDMHAAAMPQADRSTLARPSDVAGVLVNWITHGAAGPVRTTRAQLEHVARDQRRSA